MIYGQQRCNRCNVAIGMAQDSPERLRALADYVESFRQHGVAETKCDAPPDLRLARR